MIIKGTKEYLSNNKSVVVCFIIDLLTALYVVTICKFIKYEQWRIPLMIKINSKISTTVILSVLATIIYVLTFAANSVEASTLDTWIEPGGMEIVCEETEDDTDGDEPEESEEMDDGEYDEITDEDVDPDSCTIVMNGYDIELDEEPEMLEQDVIINCHFDEYDDTYEFTVDYYETQIDDYPSLEDYIIFSEFMDAYETNMDWDCFTYEYTDGVLVIDILGCTEQ